MPERQTILIILSEYITLLFRLEVGTLKLVPQAVVLVVRRLRELEARFTIFELGLGQKSALLQLVALVLQLNPHRVTVEASVEVHAQLDQNLIERMILLLHLLVVAAALLSLPRAYE